MYVRNSLSSILREIQNFLICADFYDFSWVSRALTHFSNTPLIFYKVNNIAQLLSHSELFQENV